CVLAADRLTVKVNVFVPELPSVAATLLMDSSGLGSSFRMVPVPWALLRVAWVGLPRLMKNVSSGSFTVSPLTSTVIVLLMIPGASDDGIRRAAQVHIEHFVWFVDQIADDRHRDRLAGDIGSKGQGTLDRDEVTARARGLAGSGGGVVHGHRKRTGRRQGYSERRIGGAAGAVGHADVVDRQGC